MFKRLAGLIGLALLFVFAAQPARADDPPGAKLYGTYCAGCHGAAGKGGFAPAVSTEKYLTAHDDAAITRVIDEGMTAMGMPAWSKSKGGTLSDSQITDIVAYLRSFAPANAVAAAPSAAQVQPANPVFIQTILTVTQSTNPAGDIVLSAMLADYTGYPVSDAAIVFSRATIFGAIDLGTVKTGANGFASLTLRQVPEAAREIGATFKGDKSMDASTALIALEPRQVATSSGDFAVNGVRLSVGDEPLLAPEGSLITPNPPLVPTALFALVVGCVWAMYGFVIYQVYGIWKNGRMAERKNTFTRKAR
jgi:mono/diheme cytochrome c family protein